MEYKKCPACGVRLAKSAGLCTNCGLKDLDRIFLSREEYDEWVKQVLLPHKASFRQTRVYGGYEHVLILTADGKLYGLGSNRGGPIGGYDDYVLEKPRLMDTNVVSAAAGYNYSIYVTADGQVHLRGTGIYAERFPGFSGAKQVFARRDWDQFWIIDGQGKVFCFGDNQDGSLSERTYICLKTLPPEDCAVRYGSKRLDEPEENSTVWWEPWDDESEERERIERKIRESTTYRELVRIYGNDNIYVAMKLVDQYNVHESRLDLGWQVEIFRVDLHTYEPKIMRTNARLYDPVPYRDQDFGKTVYWDGSAPAEEGKDLDRIRRHDVRKAVRRGVSWLALGTDGTVMAVSPDGVTQLKTHDGTVTDLAANFDLAVVVYGDGRVYWDTIPWTSSTREIQITKMKPAITPDGV